MRGTNNAMNRQHQSPDTDFENQYSLLKCKQTFYTYNFPQKNCTMINELIFPKESENKKLKVYFHQLERP